MPDGSRAASGLVKLVHELVRQPLVHFLVIGLALGVALQWFGNRQDAGPDTTIRISAADIARAEAEWRSRWKRPPTQQELEGLVKARIREMVLYREAVAMGLDRDEPVIRRVLVQKLESIAKDLIELSLSPTDQDLEQYFEEHAERYRPASLITFTHVYRRSGSAGRTGDSRTRRRSSPICGHSRAGPKAPRISAILSCFNATTRRRIGSGSRACSAAEFARSVFELSHRRVARAAAGPATACTRSTCTTGRTSRFRLSAEVLERVRQDWVDDNRRRIVDQYFADMMARYEVVIEGPARGEQVEVEPDRES